MVMPATTRFGTAGAETRAWVKAEEETPVATLDDPALWANENSRPLEFQTQSMVATHNLIDQPGFRGTRSHRARTVRGGLVNVGGPLSMTPTADDLAFFLLYVLGGFRDADPTVFLPAPRLPSFALLMDYGAGEIAIFREVVIDTATFSAGAGELITLSLDVIGKREEEGAGNITDDHLSGTDPVSPFPQITNLIKDTPYVFSDSEDTENNLSLLEFPDMGLPAPASRYIETFQIQIGNAVQPGFRNSRFARALLPQDRTVLFSGGLPWSDVQGGGSEDNRLFYKTSDDGSLGSAKLEFRIPTAGTDGSLLFEFDELRITAQRPSIDARQEVILPFNTQAFTSDSTGTAEPYEVRITNILPTDA